MKIIVNGRNIDLTDAIKDYVHEKLERIEQHYDFVKEIHVFLSVEKNPSIQNGQLAEATVHAPGAILRVETGTEHMYASIDKLVDKIERSLRKHKTKIMARTKDNHDSIRHNGFEAAVADEAAVDDDDLADVEIQFDAEQTEATA